MFYKAIVKGKRPLQAASHAITNSSSALFSRVFVKRRISLLRSGSTRSGIPPETTPPPPPLSSSHGVPLYRRLMLAWTKTPTKWYPLPLAVGAILLVVIQYRKKVARVEHEVGVDDEGREVIKVKGPWHVHVICALPLRNMSRVWGYMNSLELPVWIRPYGFRLYAYVFGCNLEEIDADDLTQYTSLGQFFCRKLKPGARPIDNAILVSPADGTVLHLGTIENLRVEQVKGITYSLDALLGVDRSDPESPASTVIEFPDQASVERSGSLRETISHDASVAREMGVRPSLERKRSTSGTSVKEGNALYFTVIYLAPGDYHRFHSPTAWVVEKRRHFVGQLFSVSPWMANRLQNLFVLNERVALLGRWKFGFFGMIPVGATNVGSININFDTALRTNVRGRPPPPGTYNEAVYSAASPILNGQPLTAGEEMGGFCLGSTIVLVFEAPKTFEFTLKAGQKVKVGNRLGGTPNDSATVCKVKTD
ncbi:phosphatidylserine decarboxylase-domain-containing protein [Suillus fuscotomentosus]|uniref:Phosphatidylserine decarboxylase proenzyme 1, mitochondrial n=1 Tax=Suillus fuscotomentosus TaxID=1912939 RepID=A0AAD4EM14_9AGAM|nr:phosphatidylserine decarboxylase-domain-containing protein [Suillus fuscotomentosus]KAG1908585.1 phosphatidylserine decarboxylase-domain-containing protein [Suillus fuscotomentosus]